MTPVKLNDIATDHNEDKIEPSNMISTPLSPLSSLTSALDGLDICSNKVVFDFRSSWYLI